MNSKPISPENPWLGLQPFNEANQTFFFGRKREVDELFSTLSHQRFTLLFGRSGNGKTSLLNAGLVPLLARRGYLPIVVRLVFPESKMQWGDESLVTQTLRKAAEALAASESVEFQSGALQATGLWEWAHDLRTGLSAPKAPKVVLVFDQFEELFTLGKPFPDEVRGFMRSLADLVENTPPQSLRLKLESDPSLLDRFDFEGSPCRVLVTIRADFLSELDRFRKQMPSLARNHFQLDLLTGHEALEAVYRPGTMRAAAEPIISHELAEAIVRRVAGAKDETPLEEIEAVPPLVSLFCAGLNESRLNKNPIPLQIDDEFVTSCADQILPEFYEAAFLRLPAASPAGATLDESQSSLLRSMVEDHLVTDTGFRQSVPWEDAVGQLSKAGLKAEDAEKALRELEDRRLLAVERYEGTRRIELIHDLLLSQATASRQVRRAREAELLAAKQRRRIEEAEAMVGFILKDLSPRIERRERTQLFTKVQSYYQQLDPWEREAVESKANQADLLRLVGQTKEEDGDVTAAAEQYQAALRIYQQLRSKGQDFGDAASHINLLLSRVGKRIEADQSRNSAYDIYVSYSRRDNVPIGSSGRGWISAIVGQICADNRRFSTAPLRIFFDHQEVKDMDDWRFRQLGALRQSKVLLVCLSPNYFASPYCRWEWEEYLKRQVHQLIGSNGFAPVYLVEVPASDEPAKARWLGEVMRSNFTDLRPWFTEGAEALQKEEVRRRMDALGISLWQRIERARRAMAVPGNLRWQNPHFVGRRAELRQLHEQLGTGAVGVVTAIHGLGGVGKTELAVAYAHGFADCYPAGLWSLAAEGKKELLPLISELAWDRSLDFTPTEAEKNDPVLLGRGVLEHLKNHALAINDRQSGHPSAALLLLDNVSEPELLSASQLATLPSGAEAGWLRIVATTRLGIGPQKNRLATIAVDALDEDSAVTLIRDHQPPRDAERRVVADPNSGEPRFASDAEEAAAGEIVRVLGGFPLAIEQVALHLGLHPDVSPSAYLATLQAQGLSTVDRIGAQADAAAQMLTQSKQLAFILDATLARLDAPARTAIAFAAHLPPDNVPWPWLRTLTIARYPDVGVRDELAFDPWLKIQRQLTGPRLLTPGDDPDTARLHRLVASHLAGRASEHESLEKVRTHVLQRSAITAESQSAPASWELDALLHTLLHLLNKGDESAEIAAAAFSLTDKAASYRNLTIAESLLARSTAAFGRMAAADPGNPELQRDLTVTLNKRGDLAVTRGDLAGASCYYLESQAMRERLAASDPSNAAWQRDLSVSLNNLGNLSVAQGDLAGALRSFSESKAIAERLVSSDRANAAWERDLSVSLNKLGDLAVAQGDLAGALRSFSEAKAIFGRLTASDPANAAWQRDLSVSLNKLGDLAVAQGDFAAAQLQFFQAKDIAERLAASDPANAAWQRDLSASLERLGDLSVSQGDLANASRRFTECLAINERLAASDPSNAEWQRDLSVSLNKLGDLAVAQGDLQDAQHRFTQCMAISERLAARDPANAAWQRDLAVSYDRAGQVAHRVGNTSDAERWMARALEIKQRLAASDPANAAWQRDLVSSHYQMAGLAQTQQNQEKLASHLTHTFQILHRMKQSGLHLDPPMDKLYQQLVTPFEREEASRSSPPPPK